MPRARSLTLPAISSAALKVIDRDGLAGLSMRAVADELGMGTMSLYRYVDTREQLEVLVADMVLGPAHPELEGPGRWQDQVKLLVDRMRDSFAAHPAAAPLVLTHRFSAENGLRWAEALLGVLTDAGFSGVRRVVAFRSLVSYVVGSLQLEYFGPFPRDGEVLPAEQRADEFPLLAENARDGRRIDFDQEFRLGLTIVLDGLRPASPGLGETASSPTKDQVTAEFG
ncbi:TetR/AcrR family transcriptional regulator [Streptomyces sp. NBC_01643]|uniref:TetR/AcrR family transcriptional regulator n=1 Tax=Streptomyces sp. NBC_01643 TaxID=2975906 RepID=UPI002F9072FB|nr:TetR/AcrR family transcriptional regulator [Streptomyces sp. NBC_01643]